MSNFIENANWRYATKKFDATKKVSKDDLEKLKEAIRLSSSSYGLQPYQVFIIENPEIRQQLLPASWGQTQIVDAAFVVVFASITNIGEKEIDAYLKNITETRGILMESIQGYADFMKSKITTLPLEDRNTWTSKQTYIALANLLSAAAELKIDVTPMEGFVSEKYNEILGLSEKNLNASLVATVGYRHEEDATQHYEKVRKSNEELFINL
jgi:nitroreductase